MLKKEITRRRFIQTGAMGVAASAFCPALLGSKELWAAQDTKMFCYQCEQTMGGRGCTTIGVCGKKPNVAALQDLLVHSLKGLSLSALAAQKAGINDDAVNQFVCKAMFATLTNVEFDPGRLESLVKDSVRLREGLKKEIPASLRQDMLAGTAADFQPAATREGMIEQAKDYGLKSDPGVAPDIRSLRHTLLFGLKGVCGYAYHARELGQRDDKVYQAVHKGLAATLDNDLKTNDLLGLVLECGRTNLRAMELLDAGNTGTYGHPTPTEVPLGAKKGKAVLVSGHDLFDLDKILAQSAGKGIYVYTHGEMLPCHGYPKLKERYPHFYGHFGTAWQNQGREFSQFPGAILMTTNCIQRPRPAYQDNIFTTGVVGWPDIPHIADKDFTPVIQRALDLPGYPDDVDGGTVWVGFARNTIMGVADKVIEGVKKGDIRHIFLVAGCDGAKPSRNYYNEFVEKIPEDCLVMTLACGKFRFFDKKLGKIGGLPRLLDVGQCNDAYSAIQIATALAEAFDCGVNELPLSLVLSWYEQKAVAILLTLLSLGIRDMRLGPSLPAFITPEVLQVLVDNYNIMPISTPDEDLRAILA